jgi:Squalene-hopene cyclase C-terminal domain
MFALLALLALSPQNPAATPSPTAGSTAPVVADDVWFTPEQATACAAAAERGLAWLAARQLPAGCWTGYVGHKMQDDYELLSQALQPDEQRRLDRGHPGVTALCGMAFLAGGNLPDRGRHAEVVDRTVGYVCRTAQENGFLTDSGERMYGHAFATLFLAEVYGMAQHEAAKGTLERAVNLIVDSQNQHGGWRYNAFDRETDLSVTVCQVQALRAARNIGIRVPKETIDRAITYVQESRVEAGRHRGLFYYKIHGRSAYSKPDEYAINAAALTALSSAGFHDDDVRDPVLTFLDREYGTLVDYYRTHFYYWYGNYYAAQAFYQHGGPRLRRFFARLADDLLQSQQADGRWLNRTGPGDEMGTAIACILLQMPKQYLPIFQR